MNSEHYTYRVIWSEEDQSFIGLCTEFPSLSWIAEKQQQALKGIVKLVSDVIKDMISHQEKVPQPLMSRDYSGKFLVRVPPEVHRSLSMQAAEAQISLNRLVSAKLSQ